MLQACHAEPPALESELNRRLGGPFDLRHYWGPMASPKAAHWIARATVEILGGCAAPPPDLCLTYLPTLDYALQRNGPFGKSAGRALRALSADLDLLRQACDRHGYDLLLFGDYAIEPCHGEIVYPNRALRAAGLLRTRLIGRRHYPDLYGSRAFAVVDHQVAHVYVRDARDLEAARTCLERLRGVDEILDGRALADRGLAHPRGGELLAVASPGSWLAYPWWTASAEAPDYAGHVDIHNKPGYDPCELFWGWPPGSVSRDPRRVGGTHGRVGAGCAAAWAATCMPPEPLSLIELATRTRRHLETIS